MAVKPVVVRSAAENDLALLPALEAAADALLTGLSLPGSAGGPLSPGDFPPPAGSAELASARHLLVAGEPPVGFARIEEVDGQAHLEQLSVSPAAAGAGLGRRLVNAALAWAAEQGYRSMTLCTFADVPFNAPFYRTCGFEAVQNPEGELGRLRNHERQLGLDALGKRVAMRCELRRDPPPAAP